MNSRASIKIVYYDKYSSGEGFVEEDNSVSFQCRKLEVLATETYKINIISRCYARDVQSYRAKNPIKEDAIFTEQNICYSEI